jgi:hypothetical protein
MSQQLKTPTLIDVRGPRFSAAITVIVLAIALATQNAWVLALQAVVFAIGANSWSSIHTVCVYF